MPTRHAYAHAGDLDPTFGSGGVVILPNYVSQIFLARLQGDTSERIFANGFEPWVRIHATATTFARSASNCAFNSGAFKGDAAASAPAMACSMAFLSPSAASADARAR